MASAKPSERDAAATRRRMLDAAVRRIARDGMDGVRIARIAADAGVSAALVHYHFASRDALLVEALEHSYELAGDTRLAEGDGSPPDPVQRLVAIVDSSLPSEGSLRDDFLLWMELWLRASREPALAGVAARLYGRMHEWAAETLRDGVAAGDFRAVDVPRTTDKLLALLDGYGTRVMIGDPAMSLDRARREVWAGVAADLGLPPEPPAR